MSRVPTSWYESEHLLARMRAYDVPQSDPAWCVATGHLWGSYRPLASPAPKPFNSSRPVEYVPIRACRWCIRCDAAQDYDGQMR